MQLNHLNLCVSNLDAARTLFESHFDFEFIEQKGQVILIMSDKQGFTLVLMAPHNGMRPYPDGFHLGFLQEGSTQVDQIYQRLKAANIPIEHEPRKMRGSTYGFYFTALDDILFEVSSPL